MDKTNFELLVKIEKMNTDDLKKLKLWIDFNLEKRSNFENISKFTHNNNID